MSLISDVISVEKRGCGNIA